jgi:hypothetical protein
MRWLAACAVIAMCAGCSDGPGRGAQPNAGGASSRGPVSDGCFRGRLTDEGDTCQAMRTESGSLLTLGGPLRGFGPGDRVCVCGFNAPEPFCRQGTTFIIREISDNCGDIR